MSSKTNHLLIALALGLGLFGGGLGLLRGLSPGVPLLPPADLPGDPVSPACHSPPTKVTEASLPQSRGPIPDLGPCDSYAVYYGPLDDTTVEKLKVFDLVILHPGDFGDQPITRTHIAALQAAGVIVLGYVSIGEEPPGTPQAGQGLGPVYAKADSLCDGVPNRYCQENGAASYYLDEITNTTALPGHDGLPDTNGEWGSHYVDPASSGWRDRVQRCGTVYLDCNFYGADYVLYTLGADGLFLDTVDMASPWGFYDYALDDMADFICQLSDEYPDRYIVINRGVFYADPLYGADQVRPCINGLLFEAYYSEWDWEKQEGRVSPWFPDNRDNWAPKLNAQGVMTDGYSLFALDYFTSTQTLSITHQISETVTRWDWLAYISTPYLDTIRPEVRLPRQRQIWLPLILQDGH